MKFTVELSRFEPHIAKRKINNVDKDVIYYYDVAFTITHDNGLEQYAPTTINFMENFTEADVVQIAAREVIPGQVAMAYKMMKEQEEANVDKSNN